ncbi:DUF3304 domain-containing protein [Pseudomonas turukhanskensis]|uniref:Membrane protein n=1 Tax=Pseudomonas turukhanskensis TaxID=1806536 RepID=A0A9W6K4B1_9PSED|nr:DUF3304 domain-containing protein [Pseudomonas turukhanskensis]GLK89280.1 membrane protein [Pseudomonas turukhanskensis]
MKVISNVSAQNATPKHVVILLGALTAALIANASYAGALYGINHTHWAINRFSVDGNPAIDVVGPYQRGGGGWGYTAPERWTPGTTVRVDWETGVAYSKDFPGFGDWPKYLEWTERVDAQKRKHSKLIAVPDYTGQDVCGMTVHFLPCEELQVTTSCFAYGNPNYPIKTQLQLPEPTSCPQ